MNWMKLARAGVASLAIAVGVAGGASAAEFNKYAESGNFRADTAVIDSSTATSGLPVIAQDRRLMLYASSTSSIGADIWGARSDGLKLTKLGAITATSASTPVSLSVSVIAGYQRVIISPTSGLTGVEKLHVTATQVK